MKDVTAEWERVGQEATRLQPFFDEAGVPEYDRLPFAYYYLQAPQNSMPEWSMANADRGIIIRGAYEDYDLERVDALARGLIPNFSRRAHGLAPVLDIVKPLAEELTEKLKTGSILASSNHPTLASPILTARPVLEALEHIPGIADRTYITFGMLPTVFKYDFGGLEISPVGIASGVGNVAITAAVSDSNMQPELRSWQTIHRELYKANIASILAEPGNVVITTLNGQRDIQFSGFNKKARRINQPEGGLDVFVQPNAHFLNFAVFDHLLEDPHDIASPVEMYVNPRIRPVTMRELENSNHWQATTLNPTYDGAPYYHEGMGEMRHRVADRRRELGEFVARHTQGLRK